MLGVAGRWLPQVARRVGLMRVGVEAVTTALSITLRLGVSSVKEAAHHFAHAFAKLRQELNRVLIMRWLLITICPVTSRRLLVVIGRRLIVLRIRGSLRLIVTLVLRMNREGNRPQGARGDPREQVHSS